jgi:predicted metal-binding protein
MPSHRAGLPAIPTPLLFVCTTCPRGARERGPTAGSTLARTLQRASDEAHGGLLAIREVACLNGCRNPCNVALRGGGRWTYRFSHCTLADVDTLLGAALRYWQAPGGELAGAAMPGGLRHKLSARTPPP